MAELGSLSNSKLGNKYVLGELLGFGGFGEVYKAQNILLNRPQAIKVILEKHLSDPKFRERFIREAQTLAALNHPHILHVDDFEIEQERAYLVLPFISGGTLHDIMKKRGRLTLEETAAYLKQICAALDYAHARNVVHLDLKPQNLLHQDGTLLLSDFGLAHLMKEGAVEGGTSLRFGSPFYMAPEHINGQPQACSDIYALGAMLYQMLVGRPPFEGRTPEAVIIKHVMEPPPLLSTQRPDLPLALGFVIHKALAKRPEERYATAGVLLQDFHDSLAATTIRASNFDNAVGPDDPTRLASVAYTPIVVSTPLRNTPDYPARATPDQQIGREIPSPIARPWYKLGKRDMLAVELTTVLYLVFLLSTGLLFGSLGSIAGLALFVLPLVAGATSVVLSKRKGFDGLLPALMSGLAGGIVFFFLGKAISDLSSLNPIFLLLALPFYAVLSLIGAAMYITIRNKMGQRDMLAVVLTTVLYLVFLLPALPLFHRSFLFAGSNVLAGLTVLALPLTVGIISVVFSRRKGFDGLVPALMSGLAGGIVFFFLGKAIFGSEPEIAAIVYISLLYAGFSLLGATIYISIKKLGKRDMLAVVLTTVLYLVFLLPTIGPFYSGSIIIIPSAVLAVLPLTVGIISVVFSRRKGFDGLVPALMSGFSGGIVFLILGVVFFDPGLGSITIGIPVIYAGFSLLGATIYIRINRIKKLWASSEEDPTS